MGLVFGLLVTSSEALAVASFVDPLDAPAPKSISVKESPLLAVTMAGESLVAVGLRGLIAISNDGGLSWQQVASPVSSDLTSVHFPTARQGWAVGHDGVILHSQDGGLSWVLQFDGRKAAAAFPAYYSQQVEAGSTKLEKVLRNVNTNYQHGPVLPYLGVWFENEKIGYAVGSFGTLVSTRDGGQNWEPWFEHVDNEQFLNLNAIRSVGNEILVAGERGAVFRLNRGRQYFEAIPTGYGGSFFGLLGQGNTLLAYGLRGTIYRSENGGRSWGKVESPTQSAISDGDIGQDGRAIVLVSAAGEALISNDFGRSFVLLPLDVSTLTGVRILSGSGSSVKIVLVSGRGVSVQTLNLLAKPIAISRP